MRKLFITAIAALFLTLPIMALALDKNEIEGVPVYNQDYYDWSGICGPTASSEILAYWDSQFPMLLDGVPNGQVPDTSDGAGELIQSIMSYQKWTGLTRPENMGPGIEQYAANKGYTFTVTRKVRGAWTWQDIVDEIDAGRPLLLLSYSWYHYVAVVGYDQTAGKRVITVLWGHNPYIRNIDLRYQRTSQMEIFLIDPGSYAPPEPEETFPVSLDGQTWNIPASKKQDLLDWLNENDME
jgi:hypothetical protein